MSVVTLLCVRSGEDRGATSSTPKLRCHPVRAGYLAAGLFCFLATICFAQTKSANSLPHQQRDQERARAMATELVSGVLDIQLRQLEENRLEKLPIYAEIKAMRSNLDQLVDRDMQEVVQLLVQGQRSSQQDRERIAQEARVKIRSIVVTLMAERQKLYKRMHLAKLAAQIRQLISLETKVLNRARSLPGEPIQDRERVTLATLENQRDVTAIHFQFVEVLTDVATWDGPIGAGASKGIRLLRTLKIDQELLRADQALTASNFGDAERASLAAIRGWQALLEVIEETQGLAGADREAVLKLVNGMIKRQETVRDETRKTKSQDLQATERLAQQEQEIHRDLGGLAETLREFTNTEALAEQAKAAALEAEAKLFEGATVEAVQQQSQVIGALAEIAKKLEQAVTVDSDKTADQLAQEVKQLEQLDQSLDQVRAKQGEVVAQAAANAPAAKATEDHVAQLLQQANQAADFGPAIETRLTDAQDEVNRSRQVLANAAPQLASQRSQAATASMQTIDRAAAEVKQALADARRKQLAVEVGELARAAEALERAAAAEHQVSEAADDAAKAAGLAAEEARLLREEQLRVNKVASEIAAGVKNTAPNAAQQLIAAAPAMQATEQQLQQAQQNPGEATKPAAKQVAQTAAEVARQLETAARHLRQQAGQSAAELAQLAGQQLQPVMAARLAVDKAAVAAQDQPPAANRVTGLQQALAKTRAAQIEQLRASGRNAAADAQELLESVTAALNQQNQSDEAARQFAQGQTNSPLQAAAVQQQAGERADAAANKAAGIVQHELLTAAASAEEAAKELVVGNPNSASTARQAARDAMNRALQAAQKQSLDSAQTTPGALDESAQEQVSKLAAEAIAAAKESAPEATGTLSHAKQQSELAKEALAKQQPPAIADAQTKTAAALAKSVEQLQQAIQASAKQQAERAKGYAEQTQALAKQALPVDAGAAVALEQSANAAQQASERSASEPVVDPQPEVIRGLERATASLAAREQELQRDRDIAEAIAQLAKEQQAARDQIADQATKLEKYSEQAPKDASTPPAPSKDELAAAQALADAADKFAEAQRATGEGAAEISKQNEVANVPIRQGLETASELGQLEKDATGDVPAESNADSKISQNGELKPVSDPNQTPRGAAPREASQQTQLGTDFVPSSPEETARQIAGKEALDEAAKALAAQPPTSADPLAGDKGKKSQLQTAENSANPEDSQPAPSEESAAAKKGEATLAADRQGNNQKLDPSRMQQEATQNERDSRAATGNNTADPAAQKFAGEAWFAKLPPSLQKAIQSKSRRSAPRGYEERLKRYFESTK